MTYTRPWPLPDPDKAVTVQHVSDTHFGYRSWSYAEGDHMKRDILGGLIPDVHAFIHTGDITDNAASAEDTYALSWLPSVAKGKPSLWVPGNHDFRNTAGTRASWESRYGRNGNSLLDLPGPDGSVRILGFTAELNAWATASPQDDSPWTMSDATWDWLTARCEEVSGPVILANHYPPWELGVSVMNSMQPVTKLEQLIADHPNIVGMLVGHMHWEITNPQSTTFIRIGGRDLFPVLMGVSSMLSISGLTEDQSAQLPSISTYVSFYEDRWEVRYRMHGPHAWGGPFSYRMTTLHLDTGLVARSM